MEETPLNPPEKTATAVAEPKQVVSHKLSKWIFGRAEPFARGKILEIDEGEGCVAKYCRRQGLETEVWPVNLEDAAFEHTYRHLIGRFDMVFLLHECHLTATATMKIANSAKLLNEDGHLLILLPGSIALYEGLDQGFKDWKHHSKKNARKKLGPYYGLLKIRYCIIGDPLPDAVQTKSEYQERLTVFNRADSFDYELTGLAILVVGKKTS